MARSIESLLNSFRDGDKVALSRVISVVENDHPDAAAILDALYPMTGKALRIGITGPPGAGKSTLVEQLVFQMRDSSLKVGIIAVDPTSPFSGGALLGDRVRMSRVFLDEGVFIRSMASRGSSGGVAWKTLDVCEVLDAFGCDRIVIETVGVGQNELEVAEAAHITIVVLVPESGDGVQAMKAGLMEIGDIFVINKSDREGAELARRALESALELRKTDNGWKPPVVSTVALDGQGVDELFRSMEERLAILVSTGEIETRRRECVRSKITGIVRTRILEKEWKENQLSRLIDDETTRVLAGASTPYKSAENLLRNLDGACDS